MAEMPKAYEPGAVESHWYSHWMEKGYFTPRIDHSKKPFVIIMPPPNVTGELHVGHALTATTEDIMVRWHRMMGDPTLWLPGVDHAGISTQWVVERSLQAEGLTRHDLGREKFEQRVWEWVKRYRGAISKQHQRLGVSCDWTRERFTLDPGPSRAVRTTFVNLYNKGLIYRGERIINWCPRCLTALSDLEVQHRETQGHLYYIRYLLEPEAQGEYLTVATTRPETLLGDTAVAVNPGDARFKHMVGRKAVLPVVKRVVPIIADDAIDPSFGTGAVKVTPAHDPVDFEISQRHGLPLVTILDPDATLNENAGPYQGMDRLKGREALLADLDRSGLLEKSEQYVHSVGHCERCGTMVEPRVSEQWFVKIAPLADRARKAVVDGDITIIPERFNKVYLNWMENIRDWCISRQLWWGHRVPVWHCTECGRESACVEDPRACPHCGAGAIEQDANVLDTWFSSGLWPHSTLGWPDDTEDLRYFYPTTVMETGYDILFFWVARMIMMGLENTGRPPFRYVYLHGLVRDEKGEKMSKVKGNVLNPLQTIDTYGCDALRFALTTGSTPGNDSKISTQRLEAGRNFTNKLWNASRFVIMGLESAGLTSAGKLRLPELRSLPVEDRWIISRLNRVAGNVNRLLGEFQFGEAERQVYDFVWDEFCDWYIEISKVRAKTGGPSASPVLVHVLETSLRLLHPFMPFVTEELWQRLPRSPGAESIMIAPYPVADESAFDAEAERTIGTVIEVVRAIRNVRAQFRIPLDRWMEANVYAADGLASALIGHIAAMETLSRARPLSVHPSGERQAPGKDTLALVLPGAEVLLPLAGVVDLAAERKRLGTEIAAAEKFIANVESRMTDQAFLSRAPADVVEKEREKLTATRDKLDKLTALLAQLT
ncbi:MAG: valine--tRNA ligase [Dehalococcoidia bacterium]|nr:valine--tRNA ligase [Dehalococcoidia bacterium]